MANIKSAKKRINVNRAKNERNRAAKSEIATNVKKFKAAIAAKNFKEAEELLRACTSLLDNAAQDSVIHKNKADRNKAALASMLHKAKA